MNPLMKRLAALRWRVRLLDGWLGVCALVALILGVGAAVGVLDFWVHLPGLVRAALLVGLLVCSGMIVDRFLLRPFSKPCDDLSLALRVEDAYPELNDALASTVQFSQQSPEEQARIGGSESLRARTIKETLDKAAQFDFSRILDRKSATLFGAAAACVVLIAGLAVSMNPAYAATAFWRFVEPFGGHTWTRIAVAKQAPRELVEAQGEDSRWEALDPRGDKKDRIAIGRPYFIKVEIHGQIPKQAKIEIEGQSGIRSDKAIDLKRDGQSTSFVTAVDMTQHYQKFRFRVFANDGRFPPRAAWHEVEVLPPPRLIDLDGQPSPQIAIYPPAYADLPSPKRLEAGMRHLEVIAGSTVVLRAKADRKLEQAWIEYRPENALAAPASMLTFLGQTHPLTGAVQAAGGSAVWGRIPAQFEADGAAFRIEFQPALSGAYLLYLRDFDRLERSEPADLRVNLDPVPAIKLLRPGSSVTAAPDAKIAFTFQVTDEQFAAKSVWVEYRRKAAGEPAFGEATRIPLYEAGAYGKLVPVQIGEAFKLPRAPSELRLRYKNLAFDTLWALRNQFDNGDVLSVEICADDFCDIYPTRDPGRGPPIEVRIVSKQDIVKQGENDLSNIQQKLQDLEKKQKQALDTVKDTRKQEKIDPKVREDFVDGASQPQREVQEIIGNTAKEGLRRDLNKLLQTLKENGLTDTPAFRDAEMTKGALDSIANSDLPRIEPKLNQANNDLAKTDKNTPEIQKNLDDAAKLQQNVLDTLSELNKALDPSAEVRNLTKQGQDLLDNQKKLQKDLIDINNDKKALESNPKNSPEQIAKHIGEKIQRQKTEQFELMEKMRNFRADMQKAQKRFEDKGDAQNAKKIEEALKKATTPKAAPKQEEPQPIEGQMKQLAQDLAGKTEVPQKAIQQAENIQKNLEKVIDALEGRSEDATKQELLKREDAENKVRDLTKKLDRLREEAKKADLIMDKEERLKKKQELAKQHAQLQEDVNKLRRELARLNEHRAANDLNDAAQKIEDAAQKLQNGENPEADQKQAKEKLQRARDELRDAQEQLARELLIKLHDQLEALKVQQIAAIERSESFHGKLMKRNIWIDAYLDTIEGNIDVQTGIGEETDTVKEKLKGAKVFASILEKAKDSMDKAVKTMTVRRDEGKERREIELNADEKKDEIEWHTKTVKNQQSAAQRLDRLLDSLKEEIAKKKKPRNQDAAQNEPKDPDNEKKKEGGMRPRDGIPPTAELKALRAEQFDLNLRTEDFAKRNPDLNKLNDAQRDELRELSQEQQRIHELFQELVAPPPEPKAGELK